MSVITGLTTEEIARRWTFPGTPTNPNMGAAIASAATVAPDSPIHHITGTAEIDQITPPYTGFCGKVVFIPDAAFTFATGGIAGSAIAKAGTAVVNEPIAFWYDPIAGLWYPCKP